MARFYPIRISHVAKAEIPGGDSKADIPNRELGAFSCSQSVEKMEKKRRSTAATLFAILQLIFLIISVNCIDDKCGACNAVADELEIGLLTEKPRNHLDMRHRLDSKGQRKGKVIDYRVSELRIVELLDGLCEKMQEYTRDKVDSTRYEWIKVDTWENLNIDKQEARAYSKDISSFCGRLLEDTEDELAELIKEGSITAGDVGKVLCQDLSKHCPKTSATQGVTKDGDAGMDRDL